MKTFMIAAAIAATALATPAMANDFTGARVEVTAGVDDVTNTFDTTDVNYGATAGVDFPLGEKVVVGVEANVDNVFNRRDIGASVRLGYTLTDNLLVYSKAGYSNYKDAFSRELDGLRVGGGLELNVTKNTFVKAEYRYTDFEQNVGRHAGLIGLGLRF